MKPLPVALVILIAAGLVMALIYAPGQSVSVGQRAQAKNDVIQLVTAAKAYKEEYGEFPKGDRKAVLLRLQENNHRKIVFIELNAKQISKEGLFLDPWGVPYAFDLSNVNDPWAYSFGKNKTDEGGCNDDVASWK